ncbi:hypothetical protein LEMLEM_LOCUS8819 [Lemmus lemmus]
MILRADLEDTPQLAKDSGYAKSLRADFPRPNTNAKNPRWTEGCSRPEIPFQSLWVCAAHVDGIPSILQLRSVTTNSDG